MEIKQDKKVCIHVRPKRWQTVCVSISKQTLKLNTSIETISVETHARPGSREKRRCHVLKKVPGRNSSEPDRQQKRPRLVMQKGKPESNSQNRQICLVFLSFFGLPPQNATSTAACLFRILQKN